MRFFCQNKEVPNWEAIGKKVSNWDQGKKDDIIFRKMWKNKLKFVKKSKIKGEIGCFLCKTLENLHKYDKI